MTGFDRTRSLSGGYTSILSELLFFVVGSVCGGKRKARVGGGVGAPY